LNDLHRLVAAVVVARERERAAANWRQADGLRDLLERFGWTIGDAVSSRGLTHGRLVRTWETPATYTERIEFNWGNGRGATVMRAPVTVEDRSWMDVRVDTPAELRSRFGPTMPGWHLLPDREIEQVLPSA
jgi:hypothetical protein